MFASNFRLWRAFHIIIAYFKLSPFFYLLLKSIIGWANCRVSSVWFGRHSHKFALHVLSSLITVYSPSFMLPPISLILSLSLLQQVRQCVCSPAKRLVAIQYLVLQPSFDFLPICFSKPNSIYALLIELARKWCRSWIISVWSFAN